MILKYVCPDYRVKSLFDISAKWLKRNGYTKIVVDIDNTLLPRQEPGRTSCYDLDSSAASDGYQCCIDFQ